MSTDTIPVVAPSDSLAFAEIEQERNRILVGLKTATPGEGGDV